MQPSPSLRSLAQRHNHKTRLWPTSQIRNKRTRSKGLERGPTVHVTCAVYLSPFQSGVFPPSWMPHQSYMHISRSIHDPASFGNPRGFLGVYQHCWSLSRICRFGALRWWYRSAPFHQWDKRVRSDKVNLELIRHCWKVYKQLWSP